MTDPTAPSPGDTGDTGDDRAQDALRTALSRYADDLPTESLEVVPPRSRSRALLAVAAAAALVAGVLGSVTVLGSGGSDREGRAADAIGDTASATPAEPARTVSFLDVAVDVPASWPDAGAPTSQWCVAGGTGEAFPTEPYVARNVSQAATTLVMCPRDRGSERGPAEFPPVPKRLWAPHVSLLPAPTQVEGEPIVDGTWTDGSWTLTRRVLGTVVVETLTDTDTSIDGERIIDSARRIDVDANGCDTTSPAQAARFVRPEPFDVAQVESITDVVVCQYRRGLPGAGLLASQVLSGGPAATALAAIQAAPAGGGPDSPSTCVDDHFGDESLVLRLRDGDRELGDLHVYFDWCFGNGIDDGTTLRALTRESCPPLFAGDVRLHGGSATPFRVCAEHSMG